MLKNFFNKYYKTLFSKENDERNKKYGLSYGKKEGIFCFLLVFILTIAIGYISKLQTVYIIALAVFSIALSPVLYLSLINQEIEQKRFSMVCDYLTNIIPLFMQKTKVLYALKEIIDLTGDEIGTIIKKSINYIETNDKDPAAEKTALGFIEEEFPNSRVTAVNRLMLAIEKGNSTKIHKTCMLMYDDIDSWVNRVYSYQKELKSKRIQFIGLLALTIFMNTMFVFMYQSNEAFTGFCDNNIYQISTTLFLGTMVLITVLTISKLHGKWIVDDMSYLNNDEIEKVYKKMGSKGRTMTKQEKIVPIIPLALGIILILVFPAMAFMGVLLIVIAIVLFVMFATQYSSRVKAVSKYITVEFPMWLREISISLNDLTVLNAIDRSKPLFSYALQSEIDLFIKDALIDPTSIKPYNEFLKTYSVDGVTASMKVLYSIQNLGAQETEAQVTSLITRNQKLLAKSEEIRNKNALSTVELLGFAPMLIFTVQMMVNMILMMGQLMNYMQAQMVF